MSRLQKKCFIGATGMHGFLLLALVVGPGFFNKPTMDDSPILEFIPMMATDEKVSGGGSPKPPAPTPTPVVERQTPPTPAPPPQPQPIKDDKVEAVKINRPDPDALPDKPSKPQKHEVRTSSKVVKLANVKPRPTKPATADTDARANQAIRRAFETAERNISSGLSSSTKVDMPEGPGGGGVSYAPYGQIVRKIYTDGWIVPDDMTDDEATIKVSVTIARDGKVLSSRIVDPSGSAAANRSIQNTLDRISNIGVPFPAGAKESQRTFIMTFNLKAKKAFG